MPDPGADRGRIDDCSEGVVSSVSHRVTFSEAVRHEIHGCMCMWTERLHCTARGDGFDARCRQLCGCQCWQNDSFKSSSVWVFAADLEDDDETT